MKIFNCYITKHNPKSLTNKIAMQDEDYKYLKKLYDNLLIDYNLREEMINLQDKKNQELIQEVKSAKTAKGGLTKEINKLKNRIETLDNELIKLASKNMQLKKEIEELKSDRYLKIEIPKDRTKGNQKTRIKSGRGQGELKKKSAAEFVAENLKEKRN